MAEFEGRNGQGSGTIAVIKCLAERLRGGYIQRMTVEEIKAAIPNFTIEERAELARCLNEWEDDEWDRQMKQDLAAGKLDKVLKKVETDMAQGKLSGLP